MNLTVFAGREPATEVCFCATPAQPPPPTLFALQPSHPPAPRLQELLADMLQTFCVERYGSAGHDIAGFANTELDEDSYYGE